MWFCLLFIQKKKCSVKYIPITFRPRQGGVNSINIRRIFKIGKQALRDFWKINRDIEVENHKKYAFFLECVCKLIPTICFFQLLAYWKCSLEIYSGFFQYTLLYYAFYCGWLLNSDQKYILSEHSFKYDLARVYLEEPEKQWERKCDSGHCLYAFLFDFFKNHLFLISSCNDCE